MSGRRRIAVYDHYWTTYGGGEQFAGGIAAALAERHDVDLLGPHAIDHVRFREQLGIDLSALTRVEVHGDDVGMASAPYDLFVNCTYKSKAPNRAAHGLYVAHFPGEPDRRDRLDTVRRTGLRLRGARPAIVLRSGFLEPVGGVRPTDGAAVLDVYAPAGRTVELDLVAPAWPGEAPTVRAWEGRHLLAEAVVPGDAPVTVSFTTTGASPMGVWLEGPSYRDATRPDTLRYIGVSVAAVRIDGHTVALPRNGLAARLLPPDRYGTLATYDAVVANSTFTAQWIERLWGVPAGVLYPPVGLKPAATQPGPRILNIGRFFDPARGHSKKQLDLVEAFRRLQTVGGAPGWELHLVGGASRDDRAYAMAVKQAARDTPGVHVHLNAPGRLLDELIDTSSIYWHAAGLGEDPELHPHRFEHFGISTVEAMSAGLVPVVFGAAGPAEVVEDAVSGVLVHDLAGFVIATRALVADPARRATLAAAARTRAEEFGRPAFGRRLHALVDGLLAGAPATDDPGRAGVAR